MWYMQFAYTTRHGVIEGKTQTGEVELYNLDVIISVGDQRDVEVDGSAAGVAAALGSYRFQFCNAEREQFVAFGKSNGDSSTFNGFYGAFTEFEMAHTLAEVELTFSLLGFLLLGLVSAVIYGISPIDVSFDETCVGER